MYQWEGMMFAIAIVKQYQTITDVLGADGKVYRMERLHIDNDKVWLEGDWPGEREYIHFINMFASIIGGNVLDKPKQLNGKTLNYQKYLRSGGLKVYFGIIRENKKSTTVVLPSFDVIRVPKEELGHWHLVPSRFDEDDEYYYLIYQCWNFINHIKGVQLEDMTFGIEFEFSGLKDASVKTQFIESMKALVGAERVSVDDYNSIGKTWNLSHDSSIHNEDGFYGYELQSPILHYCKSDYQEVCGVLELVKTVLKGTVDQSCGTHIHFGNFHDEWNGYLIRDFPLCYGSFEQMVFDRLVEWGRRKNYCKYCQSCRAMEPNRYWKPDRCRKINQYTTNNTLENRHHHGTLDAEDIWHWMELNGRFVLQYFKDKFVFENIHSIEEFFAAIGLQKETQKYYMNVVEEFMVQRRAQIERMFCRNSHDLCDDASETGEFENAESTDGIILQVLNNNHACACA